MEQSTKNFFKAGAYPFSIVVNGNTLSTEAFFISIANSNQFGNNFTIAPQASLYDQLFDIVIVNKMSKLKMIWAVLMQVQSGKVSGTDDER